MLVVEFFKEFFGEGLWGYIDMVGFGFLECLCGDYYTQRGGIGYGVHLIVELTKHLNA